MTVLKVLAAAKFRKRLPPGQAGCPGWGGRNVSPGQTVQWPPTRGGPCSWSGGRPSRGGGVQNPGLDDVVRAWGASLALSGELGPTGSGAASGKGRVGGQEPELRDSMAWRLAPTFTFPGAGVGGAACFLLPLMRGLRSSVS